MTPDFFGKAIIANISSMIENGATAESENLALYLADTRNMVGVATHAILTRASNSADSGEEFRWNLASSLANEINLEIMTSSGGSPPVGHLVSRLDEPSLEDGGRLKMSLALLKASEVQ